MRKRRTDAKGRRGSRRPQTSAATTRALAETDIYGRQGMG